MTEAKMNAPLWQHQAAIVQALRAGEVPPHASELADHLEKALADAARRAQRGPRNAQSYSAKVRAGIRLAVGDMPLGENPTSLRDLPQVVMRRIERHGPAAFGLLRMPDIELVRGVIREMHAEQLEEARQATSEAALVDAQAMDAPDPA